MSRKFNVNGVCYPDEHYMVNIDSKLAEIKELVDEKQYFVINRARQYQTAFFVCSPLAAAVRK